MLESEILSRLQKMVSIPAGSPLKRGIGDDCAVFRPRGSAEDLLFTTDLLLEDVHFRRTTHRAEDIGRKALARGLSDIAAMGGRRDFVCCRWLCRSGRISGGSIGSIGVFLNLPRRPGRYSLAAIWRARTNWLAM